MTRPNRPLNSSRADVGDVRVRPSDLEPPVLSLGAHFRLRINGVELSCGKVSAPELAGDGNQLERRAASDVRGGVLWSAPPIPSRLHITRALDGDRTLFEWRREAMGGKAAVRTIDIEHLERPNGATLHVWRVMHAWPLRWSGPQYDALHGGIAVEVLELVYADLLWISPEP